MEPALSEYYPNVAPDENNPPQPIGRLTPFFHDITIENVNATGGKAAAVVYGLPESPVKALVMRHVRLSAEKGMVISDAEAVLDDVKVTAAQGKAIDVRPSARVTIR